MSDAGPPAPPFPRPAAPAQPPASGAIAPGLEALPDEGPLHFTARALAAQLRTVFPPSRFEFCWLDGKLTRQQWTRLTRRTPSVCLGWASVAPEQAAGAFLGTSHWFVGLLVRNEGGPEARLLGDRVGPGILSMVRAATIALNGLRIAPAETLWAASGSVEITGVAALETEAFAADEAISFCGIEAAVRYEEALPPWFDTINSFDALSVSWTFQASPATAQWTDLIQQGSP